MSNAARIATALSKEGLLTSFRMRYNILALTPACFATAWKSTPGAASRPRRYSGVKIAMDQNCPTNLSKDKAEPRTNPTNGVVNNCAMVEPTKKLLARAVTKAIDGAGGSRNAWAASKRLDVKAVERVEKAAHNVGVDFMDKLARAIGVEPWQLIHPDERISGMSDLALEAARKLDAIKDPSERARAYALWVQVVEFANRPPRPDELGRAGESSIPDDQQPKPTRRRGPGKPP